MIAFGAPLLEEAGEGIYIIPMSHRLSIPQKSILYASKTFLGGAICWYGLTALGMPHPIWSVITVMIVSDPDLTTTRTLVAARIINTLVGCAVGLLAMLLFGYSPLVSLAAAAVTVLLITAIKDYPTNWRLAPVTVVILMDAGRLAANHRDQITYALLRAGEITIGCCVALFLAMLYTRLIVKAQARKHAAPHISE